jgi:hypothetical protein
MSTGGNAEVSNETKPEEPKLKPKLKAFNVPIDDETLAFLVETASQRTEALRAASDGDPEVRVSPRAVARRVLRDWMHGEKSRAKRPRAKAG